jgi:tetratricopeptide (TPR) repeat protein
MAVALLRASQLTGLIDSWLFDFYGLLHMDENRYAEAAQEFGRALALDPDNPRARRRLMTCLIHLSEFQAATTEAQYLAARGQLEAQDTYRFAVELAQAGQHSAALPWIELARQEDPGGELPRLAEAHCRLNLQAPDEALVLYRELAESAQHPWVRLEAATGLAKAHFALGRPSEARESAMAAARLAARADYSRRDRLHVKQLIAWLERTSEPRGSQRSS